MNKEIEVVPPNERVGEVPGGDFPVEVKFDKEELKKEGERLDKLRDWAKKNKKKLVVTGSVGGVVTILFASALIAKHLLERNPKADITKK